MDGIVQKEMSAVEDDHECINRYIHIHIYNIYTILEYIFMVQNEAATAMITRTANMRGK